MRMSSCRLLQERRLELRGSVGSCCTCGARRRPADLPTHALPHAATLAIPVPVRPSWNSPPRRERGREDAFFFSCAHLSSGAPDPTQHGVERARRQEGREVGPTGGRAPPPAPSIALAVPSFFRSFLLSSSSGRSAADRRSAQRGELPPFRPPVHPSVFVRRSSLGRSHGLAVRGPVSTFHGFP